MSRGMGKPISTTARRDGSLSITARAPRSPLSARSSAKTDAAKRTGLPRPSAYRGAAMTFPGALIASISAGMTSAPRTVMRGARWVRPDSLLGGRRLHRPLGEDPQQVLLVLDRALEISLDVHALRGLLGSPLDRGGIRGLAGDSALDSLGPRRLGAGARDADTRLRDLAAVHGHHGRDPDHGKSGSRMRELGVGALHVNPGGRNSDFR